MDDSKSTPATESADQAQDHTDETTNSEEQQDTFDRSYVEKLRKEAAKYRNQAKELEPLAKKMRELEESKKSDLEKARERIAELEAAEASAKMQALRSQVAASTGVPVDFLPDKGDEESLTKAAEALTLWATKQAPEKKRIPESNAAGRNAEVSDRDAIARQILGI
ncbi:hypothetical protein I6I10_12290 [Corynebacterium glucuronolyticum]|uniref:Scaffolding protein n=1 Tax=Corynebacterium glucuronolyticum TaxID=39791 RepID=A0A7T4EF34_9CORY|nr:hypothetical protein [Corynebacterium glucuronolyticum]QQB46205.1 hypothetical protein I6I10_12290 [Corynebacterium glucuronolyticum]WKD63042.1 hypothetical protein CGLUCO_03835 [Corynebacterium glucuronolyticum DSM 44120]SMB81898.1 hypothetical protein SAMN05660745_02510 [Corynebacterium glucuronolyticum]